MRVADDEDIAQFFTDGLDGIGVAPERKKGLATDVENEFLGFVDGFHRDALEVDSSLLIRAISHGYARPGRYSPIQLIGHVTLTEVQWNSTVPKTSTGTLS